VDVARDADSVYRYGGEEILVLLPETGGEGAAAVAERGRRAVMELGIPNETSPHGVVTVSCGIATSHMEGGAPPGNWRDPISRADAALYEAKREGRNRVAAGRAAGGPDGPPVHEPGPGAGA
jgi:diguanylate cyclase (GGDEF)-like protein